MGRNGNGVGRIGNTVLCHASRPPYPRTQQNTGTLPFRGRPTNINELHYTTLGQTKKRITSNRTDLRTTQRTSGYTSTGSSAAEPTPTKPTMRQPKQLRTNYTAAAAAT